MDSNFYTNTYNQHSHYSQPSVYSLHSNFQQQQQTQSAQPNNIYSTFASNNVFLDQNNITHSTYRESTSSKASRIPESPRLSTKNPKNKSRAEQQPSSNRPSSYNTYPSNYNTYRTASSHNPNEYPTSNNIYSTYYNYNQNAANSTPYTYASYHKNNDTYNHMNSEDIFLILEDAYEPNKRIVRSLSAD
jgi:hypothetical protein